MSTRLSAIVAVLGLAAAWLIAQGPGPDGAASTAGVETAADAGAVDGLVATSIASDAGESEEGASAQPQQDAGSAPTADELERRIDDLKQREADSDADLKDLQDQVAGLNDQLEELRAEQARIEQSRSYRLARLDDALSALDKADGLLLTGTFDAVRVLQRVDSDLSDSLEEAQRYGTGNELDFTYRAQGSVRDALEALNRRDFYEAMRATEAAAFYAQVAYDAAQNGP